MKRTARVRYESPLISKARDSVRRLILLCAVGFCGFFVYALGNGDRVATCVFGGIVFGIPSAVFAWLLLGVIRFAFGPRFSAPSRTRRQNG